MMIGFIVFLIVVVVLCYVAKVVQEAKDVKKEIRNPNITVEPISFTVPVTSIAKQTNSDNEGELIAVISAAIAAISESASIQILTIRSGERCFIWPSKFNE